MKNWVDGQEGNVYSGVTARFGSLLPEKAENSVRTPAVFSNPTDCCSTPLSKVFFSFCIDLVFTTALIFVTNYIHESEFVCLNEAC